MQDDEECPQAAYHVARARLNTLMDEYMKTYNTMKKYVGYGEKYDFSFVCADSFMIDYPPFAAAQRAYREYRDLYKHQFAKEIAQEKKRLDAER